MTMQWYKFLCFSALLSIWMFPITAYGQFYLGAGAGQATYKDVDEVEVACTAAGAVCTVDDADTGFKVFAGYQFAKFVAIEVGYVELGEVVAVAAAPVSASARFSTQGGYAALLPQLPIGPVGSIFGRLGLSAMDAKLKVTAPGISSTDSSGALAVVFGVGAEIHLSDSISVRGEWERHSPDEVLDIAGVSVDAPDVDLVTASIVARF